MENFNIPKKLNKRIVLILFSICIVIITISVTVYLLNTFGTSTSDKAQNTTTKPLDIISVYSKPGSIAGLPRNIYKMQLSYASAVIYKTSAHTYEIVTPTSKSVKFTSIFQTKTDDTTAVKDQTKTFMEKNGFKIASFNPKDMASVVTYTTFKSNDAVCQLSRVNKSSTSDSPSYYSLSCADISAIDSEYSKTENLLSVYKNQQQTLPSFTKSVTISKTEGNKAYSIVVLSGAGVHNKLLFAAIDNEWEYLGDLSAGITAGSKVKYALTPELKAKINDTEYGTFISKDIY